MDLATTLQGAESPLLWPRWSCTHLVGGSRWGGRDSAAGRNLHNPLALSEEDPMVREVNDSVERNSFPEKEYLRQNYALPGRWQRPVEEDIHP